MPRGRTPAPFPLVAVRDVPEIVKQDWLVEGLLPRFDEGAAGYLFGPPKARKSLLLADLALSVTTRTLALGRFAVAHQGAAVGFFAEDARGETSRRVHRLARGRGVEVPANLHLLDVPSLALDDPAQRARLTATLASVPDLAFVWLDPMVRLHTLNDNRAEELGPLHTFLRSLSRSLPSAVIVLAHHTNKSGGSRGSTDYDAFGDFNIFAATAGAHTTKVHRIENRGGPPGAPFTFTVEDDEVEGRATMRLVADDIEADEAEGAEVEQRIATFRASHPDLSASKALDHLRADGVKVSRSDFLRLWKGEQ